MISTMRVRFLVFCAFRKLSGNRQLGSLSQEEGDQFEALVSALGSTRQILCKRILRHRIMFTPTLTSKS